MCKPLTYVLMVRAFLNENEAAWGDALPGQPVLCVLIDGHAMGRQQNLGTVSGVFFANCSTNFHNYSVFRIPCPSLNFSKCLRPNLSRLGTAVSCYGSTDGSAQFAAGYAENNNRIFYPEHSGHLNRAAPRVQKWGSEKC